MTRSNTNMPEISIKPETIFHILGFPITNSYISSLIVIFLFFLLARHYKKQSVLPVSERSRLFYLIHFINTSIYDLFASIVGDKIKFFYPLVGGFFIYILMQNWFGLVPGVGSLLVKVVEDGKQMFIPLFRGNTADLNTTLGLALVSVSVTQYYGVRFLGFKEYIKKYLNFSNPIDFFNGILEIISELSKILSFSFRLFGNIFAGEVLLTIMAFLVPVLAPFPFLVLELFVGLVQALVFAMLTAVFINLAVTKHH